MKKKGLYEMKEIWLKNVETEIELKDTELKELTLKVGKIKEEKV